jgi:hypothetical protein
MCKTSMSHGNAPCWAFLFCLVKRRRVTVDGEKASAVLYSPLTVSPCSVRAAGAAGRTRARVRFRYQEHSFGTACDRLHVVSWPPVEC